MGERIGGFARARRPIGLAEVRASFRRAGPEPICLAYFARPLANLATPAFYNAGFTADRAIALRLAVGLLALALLAIGNYWTGVAGLVVFALAYVLDCVDGNLSRLCDEGNYWGKFIDGLVDDVVLFLAPFAIGTGLWAAGANAAAVIVGAVVSLVALLTGIARHRLGFVREWMTARTGPLTADDEARLARFARIGDRPVRLVANLFCFAPWLILLPEGGRVYLGVMLVVGTSANLVWLATLIGQASAILRRARQAAHAARPAREEAR